MPYIGIEDMKEEITQLKEHIRLLENVLINRISVEHGWHDNPCNRCYYLFCFY